MEYGSGQWTANIRKLVIQQRADPGTDEAQRGPSPVHLYRIQESAHKIVSTASPKDR
jgi:hypothetical protein